MSHRFLRLTAVADSKGEAEKEEVEVGMVMRKLACRLKIAEIRLQLQKFCHKRRHLSNTDAKEMMIQEGSISRHPHRYLQ